MKRKAARPFGPKRWPEFCWRTSFHPVINSDKLELPWGYTQGLHRQVRACRKALFYGAFSKPFYYGGEGGILCQGPKDLENCCEISVSRQPRWVVCTASMYRNRRLSSSGFEQMVNAFQHPAHRQSESLMAPEGQGLFRAMDALVASRSTGDTPE